VAAHVGSPIRKIGYRDSDNAGRCEVDQNPHRAYSFWTAFEISARIVPVAPVPAALLVIVSQQAILNYNYNLK